MLRFSVEYKDNGDWKQVEDGSYCTLLNADKGSSEFCEKAAKLILEFVLPCLETGNSIKKLCEKLSWIEWKDVEGGTLLSIIIEAA